MNRQSILARYKASLIDEPLVPYDPYPGQPERPLGWSAGDYGAFLRGVRVTMADALAALRSSGIAEKDEEAFLAGLYGAKACLHFVGMKDARQYRNACRVWGRPDYDWPTATFRILGDMAPHDTVIFGTSAFARPKKWSAT